MPKVVITGGAGFIGSNLAESLIDSGWDVVAVDDLSFGSLSNLQSIINNDNFNFVKSDICIPGILNEACRGADCVVHLAAYKIPRYGNALKTLNVNNEGTQLVLKCASKINAKTVIASTSDVYGKNPNLPFSENHDIVLGAPHIRRWSYAISKAFDEQLAMAYFQEKKLPVAVIRFFGSYGPHNHRSWWGGPQAVFIEQALNNKPLSIHGDGLQTRSFCYISDTVNGIIKVIESDDSAGQVINIGSAEEVNINTLAKKIIELTGSTSELQYIPYERFGGNYEDVRRRVPDLSKAKKLLGFEPVVFLNDGLKDTISWHEKFYQK